MPAPKRTEELQRPRERAGVRRDPITKGELRELDLERFQPDPDWHPIARMLWDGAMTSGQADWYQNSDLAVLYSVCEDMSMYKDSKYKRSGQMLQTIMSTLGDLMMTEGDRRRVRLELQRPQEEQASHADAGRSLYDDFFAKAMQKATVNA